MLHNIKRVHNYFVVLLVAMLITAAYGGCSQRRAVSDLLADAPDPDRLQFEFILGGSDQEHYWQQIKAGATAASNDYNVELAFDVISNPSLQRDVIESMALDSGTNIRRIDGAIFALIDPSIVFLQLGSLSDAGIDVSVVNTDIRHFASMRENITPVAYLGQSSRVTAQIIAKWVRDTNANRVLCIVHQSDTPSLSERCSELEGVIEDEVELITIPLGNATTIQGYEATLTNRLQNIQETDFIITLSVEMAELVSKITVSIGKDVWIGTFGVNDAVSELLQDREVIFALSQQPFLQGYLSVAYLYLHMQYGIAATEIPQITGPQIFDSGTVTLLTPFMQNGTR